MKPNAGQPAAQRIPPLTIGVAGERYTVEAADAPITIGREWPAQVVINHPGISIRHLRIAATADGNWRASDHSTNGSFLNGVRQREFAVVDGLTIQLGSADDGIVVAFRLCSPELTGDEGKPAPDPESVAQTSGPGSTETEAVADDSETTMLTTTAAIDPPILVQAVDVALTTINKNLGLVAYASFQDWARGTLPELRRLEAVSSNAAQAAAGSPELMMTLSRIRRTFRQVMLRAAQAPGATAGQKLFQARHDAQISVDEAANAVQVTPETILAAEADQPVATNDAAAIKRLQAWLTHC